MFCEVNLYRYGGYFDHLISLYCTTPRKKAQYTNIILPFSLHLWIVFGISICAVSIVLAILRKLEKKLLHKDSKKSSHSAFFDIYGIIFAEYTNR